MNGVAEVTIEVIPAGSEAVAVYIGIRFPLLACVDSQGLCGGFFDGVLGEIDPFGAFVVYLIIGVTCNDSVEIVLNQCRADHIGTGYFT